MPPVPGGVQAEPLWAELVGASPSDPGHFFRALLDRDGGRLIAFYGILSGLDVAHQKFFEASVSRTREFYKLFENSAEAHHQVPGALRDAPFSGFLRSVPLASDGHLEFPGSPSVWNLAAGRSASEKHIDKLVEKVSGPRPPR